MLAWHFLMGEWPGKTRYHQITPPKNGIKWKLPSGKAINPCFYGLHASPYILDALAYHKDNDGILCRVKLSGTVIPNRDNNYSTITIDKYAASERTILWRVPISEKVMLCLSKAAIIPALRKVRKYNLSYKDIYAMLIEDEIYWKKSCKKVLTYTPYEPYFFSTLRRLYYNYNKKTRERLNNFIVENIIEGLRV